MGRNCLVEFESPGQRASAKSYQRNADEEIGKLFHL